MRKNTNAFRLRKKEAHPNRQADKFKTIKQLQGTKIEVLTEILARTKDGEIIALNWLPNGMQCLILCKVATLEIEIETMIDNYLKRMHHEKG
jgi:hypothetical protein